MTNPKLLYSLANLFATLACVLLIARIIGGLSDWSWWLCASPLLVSIALVGRAAVVEMGEE